MIRRRLYNPAQLTPDELKALFVARGDTLAEMLRLLREQKPGRPCQHMMLLGPRGMGKTTLGLRFLHAVTESSDLSAEWQPVPFYEESYEIGNLADFWLAALRHLSRATDDPVWADRADAVVKDEQDEERQAAFALAALADYCQSTGKRLILLVENIDGILEQVRNEREIHTLRATLIARPEIFLLGSANAVFEAIRNHGRPFYEFFRLVFLEGIGPEETGRLLDTFARSEGRLDIPRAMELDGGRLETLRRLTDGNPRLLVLACRMLIESPLGTAFEDLEQLIDEQTPYFKARIEELPIQARKVFHCLADGWKPMLAKEVAEAAKLSSSHASAQIRQLVEKGYAKEVRMPGTKRLRYEVSDRFYNIYYLLRFSRTNRHRLERLLSFLHDLFGASGMRPMYSTFLEAMRADASRAGESWDLLEILAGYVTADQDFLGRDDWRRDALDLASEFIGENAPVVEKIQFLFERPYQTTQFLVGEWLPRGIQLIATNQYVDAVSVFRGATEDQPENPFARFLLGISLFLGDNHEDAVVELELFLKEIPPDDSRSPLRVLLATALAIISVSCCRLNHLEGAIASSKQLAEYADLQAPHNIRRVVAIAFSETGRLLADSDRLEEAVSSLHEAVAYVHPDDPAELRSQAAWALKFAGDLRARMEQQEKAVDAWQQVGEYVRADDAAELRRAVVGALVVKGWSLFPKEFTSGSSLDSYEESISTWLSTFEYVREDDPEELRRPAGTVSAISGDVLSAYGEFQRAEAACRTAAALAPTLEAPWRVLAIVALRRGDDARLKEADGFARRAVDLAPDKPIALHTLSDVLARVGKWGEALDWLDRAVRADGDDLNLAKMPGLADSFIRAVAAGHGKRARTILEESGLTQTMEPLWHAVRAELGEELEPLPAEVRDTVSEIRQRFANG